MNDVRERVQLQCDRIGAEVLRAMQLHPSYDSLHHQHSVILEEFEEFWEQVKINPLKLTVDEVIERRRKMQSELLQIAAMCIRATIDCDLMG